MQNLKLTVLKETGSYLTYDDTLTSTNLKIVLSSDGITEIVPASFHNLGKGSYELRGNWTKLSSALTQRESCKVKIDGTLKEGYGIFKVGDESLDLATKTELSDLGTALNNEIADRINAITAEETARGLADAENTGLIEAEATAREDADAILLGLINNFTAPVLQSLNIARFAKGLNVAPYIFDNLLTAVNSFSSPGASKVCQVIIEGLNNTGFYYIAPDGCLDKSYVNIRSTVSGVRIAFKESVRNKIIELRDMIIILGAGTNGGSSVTRQWQSLSLINCKVYNYQNLELTAGRLENTDFYNASGKSLTLKGYTYIDNVKSTNPIIFDGSYTGYKGTFQDDLGNVIIPELSMPDDITGDIS